MFDAPARRRDVERCRADGNPQLFLLLNGFAQFGMRHALDFEPFLFVLMALAARRGLRAIGTALCLFSMLAGAWGIWYWRAFIRTG